MPYILGTIKTGTTTIQQYLADNQEVLLNEGIYVLQPLLGKHNIEVQLYCRDSGMFDITFNELNLQTISERNEFKVTIKNHINRQLTQLPSNIMLPIN